MAGASLGARGIDLGLHFFRGERRQVQRIELGEGFAEALRGLITHAFLAGAQEIHEVFHFRALLWRQRLQLLEESGIGLGTHGMNSG
jgi:hypothetical protein